MSNAEYVAKLLSERFLNKPLNCLPTVAPPLSGEWTRQRIMEVAHEIVRIASYNPGLDEALNSGDGTYRP